MRLERVIARDSRRATEQVIEQFGADALIISNQKVNGMTEIVVAVDIDSTPLDASDDPSAANEAIEQAELTATAAAPSPVAPAPGTYPRGNSRPDERIEPVLSMPASDARSEPGFEPWNSADSFGKALRDSLGPVPARDGHADRLRSGPAAERAVSRSPSGQDSAGIPAWLSAKAAQTDKPITGNTTGSVPAAHPAASDESDGLRARELVDMVREELASMRREIALSRQMVVSAGARRVGKDLQPLVDALEQAGLPVALRSLLIDHIAEASDIRQALQAIRKILASSIKIHPERQSFTGLQVLAGPSGSGKTHMVCRLAARHASHRGAASVAILSFADQRIGAWTQLQMLASRSGVDCFRVADSGVLRALLGELSSRELILVDTSASGWREGLDAIHDCAPQARFNLLLPADASSAAIQRHAAGRTWTWSSLMLSKFDESLQPWPLIQSLCNQEFALSMVSSDATVESAPREFEAGELIDHAFAQTPELHTLAAPEPLRTRKATSRKATRDIRNAA